MFGLGATLSNFLGQHVVEQFGHVASLSGSLVLSIVPIVVFSVFMPETLGDRGSSKTPSQQSPRAHATDTSRNQYYADETYVEMK